MGVWIFPIQGDSVGCADAVAGPFCRWWRHLPASKVGPARTAPRVLACSVIGSQQLWRCCASRSPVRSVEPMLLNENVEGIGDGISLFGRRGTASELESWASASPTAACSCRGARETLACVNGNAVHIRATMPWLHYYLFRVKLAKDLLTGSYW